MKKFMTFITNLTQTVYNNVPLRITFFVLVILLVAALYLFTEGQQIAFVYNDF